MRHSIPRRHRLSLFPEIRLKLRASFFPAVASFTAGNSAADLPREDLGSTVVAAVLEVGVPDIAGLPGARVLESIGGTPAVGGRVC